MNLKIRENKGITLITLVITIIVLLILVTVTLLVLTGENGILNKAETSTVETYHSTVKEQIILGVNTYKIDSTTGRYKNNVISYLIDNEYTKKPAENIDYDRVQVETIAKNIKTGKGKLKIDGDIYVIEETETKGKYVLRYYQTENNYKDLLYLYTDGTTINPNPSEEEKELGDIQITYVEDLLDLQIAVNSGDTKAGKVIALQNNLDFQSDSSYKDVKSTSYGDLNGDGKVEDIRTEILTKKVIAIGTEENKFAGTFTGNNYNISNMIINGGTDNTGMFMYNVGTIKNVTIDNVTLVGKNTSSIVYENDGIIENCHIENSRIIHTGGNIGGIAYKNNESGMITGCTNINNTYNAGGMYAGSGIVAINDGTIKLCTNNTSINGSSIYSGGIAYQNNGTITQCTNTGDITAGYIGGIVYENNNIVTKCTNLGNITSNNTPNTGGIIGENKSSSDILDCINKGTINGNQYTGGIIGRNNGECKVINCNNNGNIINRLNYTGGIVGESSKKIIIENCNNYNTIIGNDNYTGGIIASSCTQTEIRNCTNEGEIQGTLYVGGIVGELHGDYKDTKPCIIEKCKNKNAISHSGSWAAGIIGKAGNINTNINNCSNQGNIETENNDLSCIGGIAGSVKVIDIKNCINSGNITASGKGDCGGIIGIIETGAGSNVFKCFNTGNIISILKETTNGGIGGILGEIDYQDGLKLNQCFNTGDIQGSNYVGGIIGYSLYDCNISNVYNIGNISGKLSVGGIAGYCDIKMLKNAYNYGEISGEKFIGGMIGDDYGNAEINNVYNAGIISGTESIGILVGATGSYNMKNLYYKQSEQNIIGTFRNSSSYLEQIISTPMDETDMKSESFVNTLNTNVSENTDLVQWKLDETTGYPTLDFTNN